MEENIESLQQVVQTNMDKDSSMTEGKSEDLEQLHSEIEIIKNEFAERGNLYIRLCEELESDRLDNKLMKEELESEFNIIQQQFESFDTNIQEQISNQINENIDYFIENFKNDMKGLRTELDHEREDNEAFLKKKLEDLKSRIDTDSQEFDGRLARAIKDINSRHQSLVEKMEIESGELQSKIKKVDNKIEVFLTKITPFLGSY